MSFQPNSNGVSPSGFKPAILCLHGGGTNAAIFQIQTIRIQRLLSSHFEFIFLDAPFESGPGPGVLPTFEGCGPFYRWISEIGVYETPEKTKELIARLAQEQKMKDGRGFVGVLGFSQGAKLSAGLLLEQQLGKGVDWGEGLHFGVLCNGTSPPLTSNLSEAERMRRIACPTLHLIGLEDPWREEGRKLKSNHCDETQAVLLEFDVDHRLPITDDDNNKVAAEILRIHRETSRQSQAVLGSTT
jgi:predicted esterase